MSKFLSDLQIEMIDDGDFIENPVYRLTSPLKYQSDLLAVIPEIKDMLDNGMVVVPAGAKTDLASIPFPINKFVMPDGKWRRAAVVHDFLCKAIVGASAKKWKGLTREDVDRVFYEAMLADGVSKCTAKIFYRYVRLYVTFFA